MISIIIIFDAYNKKTAIENHLLKNHSYSCPPTQSTVLLFQKFNKLLMK